MSTSVARERGWLGSLLLCFVLAGAAAAVWLERFLRSFLFGVGPADPITLAAVGAGMILATAVAGLVPALRIIRLNPAETLRTE